ncbi:polymeric immunoglobulin receptor [Loxodonta africana]|uniref:polymeric immunoglobulin receptor n=1 Tax=Loxodonta africana TaxID=9785 RepID=UPI000C811CE9|nr:polymeric immunoglobulin receptor [Loxodonta africana]
MTSLFLTCLLTIIPAVFMKSPIFGPQEVSTVEGNSVSIKCYYPATSVNRHARKYWCRQNNRGSCNTLISSGGFVSKDYTDRANLTNFPEDNLFVVDIKHLIQNDTGKYKCGLGINNRGLSFDVSLEVNKGPGLSNNTQVYREDWGSNVTIICPFKAENTQKKKSLCKKTGQDCVLVIDSTGYVSPNYKDRAHFKLQGTSQLKFSITINRLRPEDAGAYACKAGEEKERDVDLQVVKPEPGLIYGDLRGSVSFECALGPEKANVPKLLCRVSTGEACDLVINTQGERAPGFEGRILLTSTDKDGSFSVLITGLRKEDAGLYLCRADGQLVEGRPTQAWQLFVNEETSIPHSPSVVKGVPGGSVAVLCPYNPRESNHLKYWCRWEKTQKGRCPLLVESEGLVNPQYEGRLALYEEPGNGTYTIILNQLTAQDAGFYWCLTNGDSSWRSTVELKVVEGEPNLQVPRNVTAWLGETLNVPCHFPCKFYSHEKYWCKWSNRSCLTLPSQDEGPSQAFVNCNQNSQVISLTLNSVKKADEGWYWCGVKQGHLYGETAAVYVTVEEGTKESHDASQASAVPNGEVVEPNVRESGNKVVQVPRLVVEEDSEDPAGASRVNTNPSSAEGQGGGSPVLVSTLVPLALVLGLGAVVVGVLRARHRKNVDRVSIRSYRTDITMSDFDNSRDFGANDNMGASPISRETSFRGKDDFMATTESTMESEEPKKAKRSSKEEADMAYTAFLLQSNNMAASIQDGPREA